MCFRKSKSYFLRYCLFTWDSLSDWLDVTLYITCRIFLRGSEWFVVPPPNSPWLRDIWRSTLFPGTWQLRIWGQRDIGYLISFSWYQLPCLKVQFQFIFRDLCSRCWTRGRLLTSTQNDHGIMCYWSLSLLGVPEEIYLK